MCNYNILEEFEEAPYLAFYLGAGSFSITITQGYFRRHSWLVFGPEVTFFCYLTPKSATAKEHDVLFQILFEVRYCL